MLEPALLANSIQSNGRRVIFMSGNDEGSKRSVASNLMVIIALSAVLLGCNGDKNSAPRWAYFENSCVGPYHQADF
jgi:hypothetical protein